MIREKHKVIVERTVCTCDRCGKDIIREDDFSDWQERFAIRFRGGYGSVFGDGNTVEGDFCQNCIHEVLGKYCRIKLDSPFNTEHKVHGDPERIYQPNQLDLHEQAEASWEKTQQELVNHVQRRLDEDKSKEENES